MRPRKNKGRLRNFYFVKEADDALVRLAEQPGRNMVTVIEDLLLGRSQTGTPIDRLIDIAAEPLRMSRTQIMETAIREFIQNRLRGAQLSSGFSRSGGESAAEN